MSRTLVLVRHGDALGREPGQTDAQRSLSDAGMRALEEAFPRTFGLLEPAKSSELWVSTALRARQTAKIANETLGIESVYELKCLYDQDHKKFLDTYAGIRADLVVAVGHIPFVEHAVERVEHAVGTLGQVAGEIAQRAVVIDALTIGGEVAHEHVVAAGEHVRHEPARHLGLKE